MGVARRWIFPILRIIVLAAIAAALVKLAFFDGPADAGPSGRPTGEIVDPKVEVTVGTIRNDIVLEGTVEADAPSAVLATLTGEVAEVAVKAGQTVKTGQEILKIRGFYDNGMTRWSIVRAPASGVLTSFDLLVGMSVSIGQEIAKVAPPTFHVSAPITPEDRYRLLDLPAEAEVGIRGGPAPFTCTGLRITDAAPGSGEGDPGSASASVRCAIPADVRVFPGLTATVTIAGGIAEDVLTLPVTAVEGTADTGIVYVVGPDGEPVPREVTLGINDGVTVEITGGVELGELVFQFIPGGLLEPGGPDFPGVPGFPVKPGVEPEPVPVG